MIAVNQTKIWMCLEAVDFRFQIDGLLLLVADKLNEDPTSGHLFIFHNSNKDRIKILYWDNNGFCLLYKRLERGRFKFDYKTGLQKVELTKELLTCLLSGMDISKLPKTTQIKASCFS